MAVSDAGLQMQTDLTLRLPRQDEEEEFMRAHRATSPEVPGFLHYYNAQRLSPAYSPQHVYRMVIDINATPQFLTLGHGDPGVFDNSGHFASQLFSVQRLKKKGRKSVVPALTRVALVQRFC